MAIRATALKTLGGGFGFEDICSPAGGLCEFMQGLVGVRVRAFESFGLRACRI